MFLIINLILLGISLLFSFNEKANFYSKSKYLLTSLSITIVFFSILDLFFTAFGIWKYDLNKSIGFAIFQVPIGAFLLYGVLCFCFLVCFEYINSHTKKGISKKATDFITIILFLIYFIVGLVSLGNMYTSLIAIFLAVLFFQFLLFPPRWLPNFYKTFAIIILPLLISQLYIMSLKLITYNITEKSQVDIINIPIENGSLLLLIGIVSVFTYQLFMPKKRKKKVRSKMIEKENNI